MQNNITSRFEEQELEEGVQDLLDHFIVFLLGAEEVLQHLDQVRWSNHLGDNFSSANCSDEHHALKHDVILGKAIDQIVVKELYEVGLLNYLGPGISCDVDHGSKELKH